MHEAMVLLAVAEAGGGAEAAVRLGRSFQTIKNTLDNVRHKTNSKTTLQAYHRLVGGVRLVTEVTQRIETEDS